MPIDSSIRKVMVIGSGPIVIGQAAEFDYAGAQACRVLHDAGVNVVLVNSNPATIMTDKALADEIYLEPLTLTSVKRIIEKEQPDSLLAGLGGQTGLTLAMELDKEGFLQQHNVRLIGTNAKAIDKAEDRELFKETMAAIGEPTIPSGIANTVAEALAVADRIGYPVIIRPAFTLGGAGGGVAYSPEELTVAAQTGLDASPITQILVERYIYGWKEIEFETMRDGVGNVIAVCSMENFDPVGVHTGDSIVVAPALTLSDKEFQMLRSAALNIISALDIVGGCNCQFALNPDSFEYAVIEVNPRVSRSSALASKATGYPIAKITTKIALGYTLDEIQNDITGKTCACFEPALDYVVVKFPKWPFDKFVGASRRLGTQMKATGEVMAIGTNFESALLKAVRGAEIHLDTLHAKPLSDRPVRDRLADCDDHRLFTVFEALCSGVSIDEIHDITRIDRWFLSRLQNLVDYEASIQNGLTPELYQRGKYLGYPDAALRRLSGSETLPPFRAGYKMVDTCAAEFDAQTPYFYASADARCEARTFPRSGKPVVMVLGSGPIRIGQGIEFDYSSVHCVWTLKAMGYDVVIVNNNPETVSTDYDTADRLYFEPLTAEDVLQIIDVEQPVGVVVAFGGQTAIALTQTLDRHGIRILGTSAEGIDIAEDRERFDELLERFHISRPKGMGVQTLPEALHAAQTLGYPVLLRPSYVIGGQNMKIVHDDDEVTTYMQRILAQGIDNPVLVDKYMMGTELEVDVISDGTDVLIPGIMEHVERTGIHSGDSISVYPTFSVSRKAKEKIIDYTVRLGLRIGIVGLYNIQFILDGDDEVYVIEVNPRSSRTVPFLSKSTGVQMAHIATQVILGRSLREQGITEVYGREKERWYVKAPAFSFAKIRGMDSYLSPEMKSTGEAIGYDDKLTRALYKALQATGMNVSNYGTIFVTIADQDKEQALPLVRRFYDLGFNVEATTGTAEFLREHGIRTRTRRKLNEGSSEIIDSLRQGHVSYVINTIDINQHNTRLDGYEIRRTAVENNVTVFTALETVKVLLDVLEEITLSVSTIDAK